MPPVAPPRPFNPNALKPYAVPWLTPNVSNWSAVWCYTAALPRSLSSPLRYNFCCGDVFAVLVAPSFGGRLLRAPRCLAIPFEHHLTRQFPEHARHRGRAELIEHFPVPRGDRHHHAGIGLTDLQHQVIGRQLLAHHVFPVGRP